MLILFDLDDTLVDQATAAREAADALVNHLGLESSDFHARWFAALDHHYARYLAGEIGFQEQRRARVRDTLRMDLSDDDADATFQVYLAAYERNMRLFPDVLPCLNALAKHSLGIVTNGNTQQQRRKLTRLGILDRFACIVVSDEFGSSKPDPRIFPRACELAATAPPDALHVGDLYDVDVVGAERAGLRAVWLDRSAAGIQQPARTRITTLASLPALV